MPRLPTGYPTRTSTPAWTSSRAPIRSRTIPTPICSTRSPARPTRPCPSVSSAICSPTSPTSIKSSTSSRSRRSTLRSEPSSPFCNPSPPKPNTPTPPSSLSPTPTSPRTPKIQPRKRLSPSPVTPAGRLQLGRTCKLPGVAWLEKFGADGVLVDRIVPCDDGEAALGDEVVFLVLVGVVTDDGAIGDVDVAGDDGVADAAMASDVDVREDDGRVDVGVGVHAHILRQDRVAHD